MSKNVLFSSESVTEGHPDKMCDQISDAILDKVIEVDPDARVACETAVTTGLVLVMGEITAKANMEFQDLVRSTVKEIGYNNSTFGFDADTCAIITSIDKQSEDIAIGVDNGQDEQPDCASSGCFNFECDIVQTRYNTIGAGDQGMTFGYACQETEDYMPMPIYLAHNITKRAAELRKSGEINYLGPDGKAIVTVEYQGNKPVRISSVGVSVQHLPDVGRDIFVPDIINKVIVPELPEKLVDSDTRFMVNPTGRFVKGGPCADTGLTGRKVIVDTYGGFGRHGGGAFSGKDPTKVDRTGAYAARHIAKNIVASGLAEKCEVQIAYIIGVARPVSIHIETFGTGKIQNSKLVDIVENIFDLRPSALIDTFDLKRPIYKALSCYGHFGRPELNLPWERLDKVEEIQSKASKLI